MLQEQYGPCGISSGTWCDKACQTAPAASPQCRGQRQQVFMGRHGQSCAAVGAHLAASSGCPGQQPGTPPVSCQEGGAEAASLTHM